MSPLCPSRMHAHGKARTSLLPIFLRYYFFFQVWRHLRRCGQAPAIGEPRASPPCPSPPAIPLKTFSSTLPPSTSVPLRPSTSAPILATSSLISPPIAPSNSPASSPSLVHRLHQLRSDSPQTSPRAAAARPPRPTRAAASLARQRLEDAAREVGFLLFRATFLLFILLLLGSSLRQRLHQLLLLSGGLLSGGLFL